MKNRAFTLIELLVVVLIIGILAAIAVPQYQKAVLKSRLTQWINYVSSAHKAMEIWRLSNNVSDKNVRFVGNAASNEIQGYLDIDLTCDKKDGIYCYTNIGRFNLGCGPTHCWLDLATIKSTGGVDYSKLIYTVKFYDNSYNNRPVLRAVPTDTNYRKIVCQLWVDNYGKEQMYEDVKTSCEEVGI